MGPQVDLALAFAKAQAHRAVVRVECNQPAVGRGQKQLAVVAAGRGDAARGCHGLRGLPGSCQRRGWLCRRRWVGSSRSCGRGHAGRRLVGQAATSQVLQRQFALDFRVIAPDFGTRGGIQGNHRLVRVAEIKPVGDFEWRHFIRGFHRVAGLAAQVASAKLPGLLQVANIGRRDLRQWRIALAIAGAAISVPFARRHAVGNGRQGLRGRQRALDGVRVTRPGHQRHQHKNAQRQAEQQAGAAPP